MAKLKKIVEFLNKELDVKNIEDDSNNGLQVSGNLDVKKIGFAVDGCLEVFEKGFDIGCDMIIVHHGISWKDSLRMINGNNYDRISFLIKNDISLYGCHLPLDKHHKYGNNIQLCKLLKLKNVKEFGDYRGVNIGFAGEFPKIVDVEKLVMFLEEKLGGCVKLLNFGKKKIKNIAIVSGGGASALPECIEKGFDCLLVGEAGHTQYHMVKENKTNLIIAGHYATETLGVKALMPILEKKFKVKCEFIDVPTGF